MPICIECRYPLRTLYTTYSKADDRALGKGVRLTQCPRCKRFGDKYVEHDFVVLFIDLVLIKPQVYRHLLFNRLGREDDRFDPSIIRLGILLLLFDVYLTWARIEKAAPQPFSTDNPSLGQGAIVEPPSVLSTQPLVLQYIFFLGLCTAQTLAFHLPIRLLCSHPPRIWLPTFLAKRFRTAPPSSTVPNQPPATATTMTTTVTPSASGTTTPTASISSATSTNASSTALAPAAPAASTFAATPTFTPSATTPTSTAHGNGPGSANNTVPLLPPYPHPTPLSTALLVSSCTKLFPLLLIIWDYDLPSSASAVSWAVIVNNVAALEILMDCGYLRAGLLVGIGAAVRAVVGELVLASVGLRGSAAGLGAGDGGQAGGWTGLFWGGGG
ncbi:arv1-like protein [Diplodia corticola]|uniref:Protein ARV n=1 Tax=Diplodia corticola TaxID=236234 RepID=A0A1J9RNR9_9PEZI|nr:arv1-like protein [Diplodia corticola]OJD29572.1 arv1-like protein [Diplodia corticola]